MVEAHVRLESLVVKEMMAANLDDLLLALQLEDQSVYSIP